MYNLQQTVVQSTHRQGHVLDWVIVRPDEGIHQSTQVSDGLESDHRCVLVQFDVSVSRPPPVHRLVRNIRGIDRVAFKRDLEAELCSLVNPSADQYNATLRSVLDKHAPAAKRKVTNRVSSPWFSLVSEELLQAKRSRRQAERQWRASGLVVHKELYKKAKHCVTRIVMKAKSLFYNCKISSASSTKELYS
ncbi:hypothetical protein, partial [Thiolapillus sp.]|uniref:hypothetical protein n=1 Tax=Thiolapillus sp. TaxID=2017437 RepID=UPI003AF71D12